MDKNDVYEYLRDNLALEFDEGEEGELLLNLYLEDSIIDSKKFPLDKLLKYLTNIVYYYG